MMMRRRRARVFVPVFLLLVGLVLVQVALPAVAVAEDPVPPYETTRLRVYYPLYLLSGNYVFPVDYIVPAIESDDPAAVAEAALNQLIAGPPEKPFRMMLTIPKETEVLSVTVEDNVATVDFSSEIQSLNVGSGGESAILTAIVNTVCQYPISSVRLLVEGNEVESLAGHVDITGVLEPDFSAQIQPMEDVGQHWAGGSTILLQAMDIVAGFDDDTFRPDEKVTRAQFVKLLVEACELPGPGETSMPFADVENHWAKWHVQSAIAAEIISPEDYGTSFKPDEVISREEMAQILVKASDIYREDHPEISFAEPLEDRDFTDLAEIQDKYLESALESARRGLIKGYPDGSFGPKNGLTRGEAVTVIARMMEVSGDRVILSTPRPGYQRGDNDVFVVGAATAFEANVNFRLTAEDSSEAMYSYTTATSGMGWGMFGICVKAEVLENLNAHELEIHLVSPKDGEEYSKVTVPLG
jgi:hypothetical protein